MSDEQEYREPDASYGDGRTLDVVGRVQDAGTMYCNICGSSVWTGDDGWVCDHDSAMFEYARPEQAATTDDNAGG